jgi:hypothetical protein
MKVEFPATYFPAHIVDTALDFVPFSILKGQDYTINFISPYTEMPTRRFKTTQKKRTCRKSICPCSPDVGDCPKCCKRNHKKTRKQK